MTFRLALVVMLGLFLGPALLTGTSGPVTAAPRQIANTTRGCSMDHPDGLLVAVDPRIELSEDGTPTAVDDPHLVNITPAGEERHRLPLTDIPSNLYPYGRDCRLVFKANEAIMVVDAAVGTARQLAVPEGIEPYPPIL